MCARRFYMCKKQLFARAIFIHVWMFVAGMMISVGMPIAGVSPQGERISATPTRDSRIISGMTPKNMCRWQVSGDDHCRAEGHGFDMVWQVPRPSKSLAIFFGYLESLLRWFMDDGTTSPVVWTSAQLGTLGLSKWLLHPRRFLRCGMFFQALHQGFPQHFLS